MEDETVRCPLCSQPLIEPYIQVARVTRTPRGKFKEESLVRFCENCWKTKISARP